VKFQVYWYTDANMQRAINKKDKRKQTILEQPQTFGVSDEPVSFAFRNCTHNDDCSSQADSIVCEQSI